MIAAGRTRKSTIKKKRLKIEEKRKTKKKRAALNIPWNKEQEKTRKGEKKKKRNNLIIVAKRVPNNFGTLYIQWNKKKKDYINYIKSYINCNDPLRNLFFFSKIQ